MIENQIGKRFSEALSSSIQDDTRLQEALDHVCDLDDAIESDPKLPKFFLHPSVSDKKKLEFVMSLCDAIPAGKEVRKLAEMLVQRNKMTYLKNVREYFDKTVADRLNQVRVKIVSAYPVSEEQLNKLKSSLDQALGKSAVIESQVDESLLGGVRVSIGSWVADATIKNRLALLRRSIEKEEVLSES
ncbi:ATP synthase F1 subunit delta [Nitrospina watsonii]|uniref:ATP synthase subunit delta n=1 Tax=Nitrospina watsonii TaxID=1323948 RepID=A0ABN8VY38_9BACT|nr:ATP synthase F1 subunit delta [Nitrospina watsonii]CAI2718065.1 putative ATP synthase F0, delta subunit [Nitrospina watsonii]